jgi:sec-independent protein translocase protein TatB
MFDIGWSEMLIIVIVAVFAIGPKELPRALATAGRWLAKARQTAAQFRAGFDAMVREAEIAELEKKWAEENARIMREHPASAADDKGDIAAPPIAPLAPEAGGLQMTPLHTAPELPLDPPALPTGGRKDDER